MPVKKTFQRGNSKNACERMQVLATYSAAILFGMFSIHILKYYSSVTIKSEPEYLNNQSAQCSDPPKYWGVCLWNWNKNGNLRTMNRVFGRLGYVAVNGSEGDDWDILWSIEYPNMDHEIHKPLYSQPLKMHQRVNHFLGMGFITSKSFMTTRNRDIKYILPGFSFPK